MANVLGPQAQIKSASPIHRAIETEIHIDPNPDHGDVYKSDKVPIDGRWVQTYALTAHALNKVLAALDAKIIEDERADNRGRPFVCEWRFKARCTDADGSQHELPGNYEFDARLPEDLPPSGGARYGQLLQSNRDKLTADLATKKGHKYNNKKHGSWKDYLGTYWGSFSDDERKSIEDTAAAKARRTIVDIRPHLISRAQTGARNRAVRLYGIKSWYTADELQKPLIVRRVELDWSKAKDVFGEDMTQALLLSMIEQQFGVSAERINELAGKPAPQLPAPQPKVLEAEVVEVVPPQPETPKPEKPPMVMHTREFNEVHELGFMTDQKEREEALPKGTMKQYLEYIRDILVAAGYDNSFHRANLLKGLFGTKKFKEFVTGWFWLLEDYAQYVRNDPSQKDYAKKVVTVGVEKQLDWFGAVEALNNPDKETIPL